MLIEKRFLKYVSFDTQSDESSTTSPSTEKQFDLADFLSEEMQILGVDEVERTDQGIVYGKIYSNSDEPMKAIGFIAHMDTSPDASGHDIHPRIIRSYPGGRIILNEEKREFDSCLHFFTNQIAQNVDYINAFEFFYCQICENICTNMG